MIKPTQQELTERAKQNVSHYNSHYAGIPAHNLEFYACNAEQRQLELTHIMSPGEMNIYNYLHGGAIAWLLDSCAGILCRSYMNIKACVTTNININYVRSICGNDPIVIRATLTNEGRKLIHASMDIHHMETQQVFCTASAAFFVKDDRPPRTGNDQHSITWL